MVRDIDHYLRNILRPKPSLSESTPFDKEFRENLKPIPTLPKRSDISKKKDILLIPVFNAFGCTESYAKIGAWAFYSFLANSDAIEQGVDVKLYIEETALDSVSDILRENRICFETDVLSFKWHLTDYYSLSQKLYTLLDDRLLSYENVFVADADTFSMPSIAGDRLELFSKLKTEHKSFCSIMSQQDTTVFTLLCKIFSKVIKTRSREISDFMEYVEDSVYINNDIWHYPVSVPITWMFMFKPSVLRSEFPTFLKWFGSVGHLIYTDEEVLAMGNLLGHIDYQTDLAHRHSIKIGDIHTQDACVVHGEINDSAYVGKFYERFS